jgi:ACT domain-containing protein
MADMKKAVITVLGYDKRGIIAKVSDVLYRNDANIMDISQTVMDELFNMVLIADISADDCDFGRISDELTEYGKEQNLQIRVQRSEIFEAMHQI